jgi:hypothetical protein
MIAISRVVCFHCVEYGGAFNGDGLERIERDLTGITLAFGSPQNHRCPYMGHLRKQRGCGACFVALPPKAAPSGSHFTPGLKNGLAAAASLA